MITLHLDSLHAWPKKIKYLSNVLLVMLVLLCWYGLKGYTYQQTLISLKQQQQQLLHRQAQQLQQIKKFKTTQKIIPYKLTPTPPQFLTAQQRLTQLQQLAEKARLQLLAVTLRQRYKQFKNTVWVIEISGSYQPLLDFLHKTINLPSTPLLIDYQLTQTPEGLHFQGFFKGQFSNLTQPTTNTSQPS